MSSLSAVETPAFVAPLTLSPLSRTGALRCSRSVHARKKVRKYGFSVRYRPAPLLLMNAGSSAGASQSSTSQQGVADEKNGQMIKNQVTYTSLDNNSFALRYGGTTLLIDPWLEGDLVFATPSFFRSSKPARSSEEDPTRFDASAVSAIVLMQGLPDHAHPPTLKTLPRDLPVIAPNSAENLLQDLGFSDITLLSAGTDTSPVPGAPIHIAAGRGSIVGPPWSEPQFALVFTFGTGDSALRIYHEPHGNHDPDFLAKFDGRIDAVLAPIKASSLPILANYSLVNGIPQALELCDMVRPPACIAFDNAGGDASGFLSNFVKQKGSYEQFTDAVAARPHLSHMQIIKPSPMTEVVIAGEDVGTTIDRHAVAEKSSPMS